MSIGSTSRHCYVVSCNSGDYQLQIWKREICPTGRFHGEEHCTCEPPFKLFNFPSKKKKQGLRQAWLKALNRADPLKPYQFLEPKHGHRVCSHHFVNGAPSDENPIPELLLGYEPKVRQTSTDRDQRSEKRQKVKHEINDQSRDEQALQEGNSNVQAKSCDDTSHTGINSLLSKFLIFILLNMVRRLKKDLCTEKAKNKHIPKLQRENRRLKSQLARYSAKNLIHTDRDTRFYTGIDTVHIFNTLHDKVKQFVRKRWRGLINHQNTKFRTFTKTPKIFGPARLLSSKDEFLFTLMKLKLGLLTEDLSRRFGISTTLGTMIFNSWLTAMAQRFRKLVKWPSKETSRNTMPNRYRQIPDLKAIIDCTEFFLETPKDFKLQQRTWSDYKHHNTAKVLIAVSPNSSITFVSQIYGGRVSDKEITLNSKFLDLVEPYDVLQADRGFLIGNECAARFINLQVPPGKRGQAQMSSAATAKTSRIANLRILVEQVIRQLKTFRILKNEIPINMMHSLDKIIIVCCALTNLSVEERGCWSVV